MKAVTIGDATLYLGDCLEILPTLKRTLTVISDPPYGIGMKWTGANRLNQNSGLAWGKKPIDAQPKWTDIIGDDLLFDTTPWLEFEQVILWGGNNYTGMPPARRWLVWDKRCGTTADDHGDAELAWTNLDGVIRVHRQLWRGIVRAGEDNVARSVKHHPTQKPIELMRWCVSMTTGDVVDGYMGSGTTGVACANLGRKFIGIEIEPKYFDIACERIDNAYRQQRMFA